MNSTATTAMIAIRMMKSMVFPDDADPKVMVAAPPRQRPVWRAKVRGRTALCRFTLQGSLSRAG